MLSLRVFCSSNTVIVMIVKITGDFTMSEIDKSRNGKHISAGGTAPAREKRFSPIRAIESLLFIAQRLKDPTIHEVLKLRYFADKLHLSEYGWIASGDDYVAMQFGPVASNTYNLIKAARGEQNEWIHPIFVELVDGVIRVAGKQIIPLREPKLEILSTADIECLTEAIKQYGNMAFDDRTKISHDAAWEKGWDTASADDLKAGAMCLTDIASTLENAKEVLEYIQS